jgi:hypothetical protein
MLEHPLTRAAAVNAAASLTQVDDINLELLAKILPACAKAGRPQYAERCRSRK